MHVDHGCLTMDVDRGCLTMDVHGVGERGRECKHVLFIVCVCVCVCVCMYVCKGMCVSKHMLHEHTRNTITTPATQPHTHTYTTGAVVVILWYGARLVVYGVMTPGDLSAFVLYVVFVGSSVGGIAGTLSQLVQAVWEGGGVVLLFCCIGVGVLLFVCCVLHRKTRPLYLSHMCVLFPHTYIHISICPTSYAPHTPHIHLT